MSNYLSPRDWHYLENSSTAALKFSLGEALELGNDDFADAIREEIKQRESGRTNAEEEGR